MKSRTFLKHPVHRTCQWNTRNSVLQQLFIITKYMISLHSVNGANFTKLQVVKRRKPFWPQTLNEICCIKFKWWWWRSGLVVTYLFLSTQLLYISDGQFAKNENDSIQCHKRFNSVQPTSLFDKFAYFC